MTFGHSQKLNTATDSKLGYTTIKDVYGQFSKKYSSDLSWRDFLTKKKKTCDLGLIQTWEVFRADSTNGLNMMGFLEGEVEIGDSKRNHWELWELEHCSEIVELNITCSHHFVL